MLFWAPVLNIYLPFVGKEDAVRQILNQILTPLVKKLDRKLESKVTLSMSGPLTQRLYSSGYERLLVRFSEKAKRGQVEFLATAQHHALLPLIPLRQAKRQISLDLIYNKRVFGENYNPQGFLPPELAITRKTSELVADLGFRFILVDEIAYDGKLNHSFFDHLCRLAGREELSLFFCSREPILEKKKAKNISDELNHRYFITFESFSHQKKKNYINKHLSKESANFRNVTISELFNLLPKSDVVDMLASSVRSLPDDLVTQKPFVYWRNEDNKIQTWLGELASLAIRTIEDKKPKKAEGIQRYEKWDTARTMLDEALHSDVFFWASGAADNKEIKLSFWDKEVVEEGARRFLQVVSKAPSVQSAVLSQARGLYLNIIEALQMVEERR